MKVKIIKEEKKQLNEFLSILTGMAIFGLVAFIAKKLFSGSSGIVTYAARNIDKATNDMIKALDKDPKPTAKNARERILEAKQKLFNNIEKLAEEAKKLDVASELSEKPSATLAKFIKDFDSEIEAITDRVEVSEKSKQILERCKKEIEKSAKVYNNLDVIYLLSNKDEPEGLWNKVISKVSTRIFFEDSLIWYNFILNLLDQIELSESGAGDE